MLEYLAAEILELAGNAMASLPPNCPVRFFVFVFCFYITNSYPLALLLLFSL
jgi:hypothetical protein